MSLKGSLQTVALAEVLHLLADTAKSGELQVQGPRGDGRLWFETGSLAGFAVGACHEPADALFELLRIDEGEFSFDSEATRPADVVEPDWGHRQVAPELGGGPGPLRRVARYRRRCSVPRARRDARRGSSP